ncbi:hypothetical protein PCASD_23165 [Puccinia coronata f. sp. avenae]|uniref:Casein kinase II subunit beta n=1 Tax=Puccinia coronata f. sp. avenae TaxID=200324 RepID=A0A2N5SL87_9BASI|nr:hypothetical protein PCASD_23165 [Puccinia coronata f. sp. avenae]
MIFCWSQRMIAWTRCQVKDPRDSRITPSLRPQKCIIGLQAAVGRQACNIHSHIWSVPDCADVAVEPAPPGPDAPNPTILARGPVLMGKFDLNVCLEDDSVKVPEVSLVESSAEILYGMIHQRYIITRQGLSQMNAKYESAHFGYCPRVYCQPSKVVPCGRSDVPGDGEVVLFCPNCMDIYHPLSSRYHCIDGAYFGTSFPHLLFQTYRDLAPSPTASLSSPEPPCDLQSKSGFMTDSLTPYNSSRAKIYGPRIYGFRVSERF